MRWIWAALTLQLSGYVFDIVWHGLLRPGEEPTTRREMTHHLATVHPPLYIGAVAVLLATAAELLRRRASGGVGRSLRFAVAGALLSFGAEAWHAASHLRLDTTELPPAAAAAQIAAHYALSLA